MLTRVLPLLALCAAWSPSSRAPRIFRGPEIADQQRAIDLRPVVDRRAVIPLIAAAAGAAMASPASAYGEFEPGAKGARGRKKGSGSEFEKVDSGAGYGAQKKGKGR